ncbi:MAG TPA: DUF3734 domain-containing protein [Rickettsiales bacterium]|nr:DUF3734 domain-containing protein [Rickettsiales bacterium]
MASSHQHAHKHKKDARHPFECVALLLQGGGALGAYQAGVYEALAEADVEPDWVAGISIGAINAAIIAGNAPNERVNKLREFWHSVTIDELWYYPEDFRSLLVRDNARHQAINFMSAMNTIFNGIPGFFTPRFINPFIAEKCSKAAISFYDTKKLKSTLERLVDFDRINNDDIRFNVGVVNVETGNFMDFNNQEHRITPEHVMASGALPPGFPPIEIDGKHYWDGGLISNTPLQWIVDSKIYMDTLVFQVDLWSASSNNFPHNIADVYTRQKDIQYSSRTRANTDRFKEHHKLSHQISSLIKKLPPELQKLPEVGLLKQHVNDHLYNIVHLIYHNKDYEGYSKDFEFSRLSMKAHWQSGYDDTIKTLQNPAVLKLPTNKEGVAIFDFSAHNKSAPS